MQINSLGIAQGSIDVLGPGNAKSGKGDEIRHNGPKSSQARQERGQFKQSKEGQAFDEKDVIQAIEHANQSLEGIYTHFEFSIHEKTREIMVKIIDRESGEVIREIPPEQILDMVAKMWELAGILIDEHI